VSTSFRLLLPAQIVEELFAHARAELPNECCGLLVGIRENGVGRVVRRYPLVNALADPKEYLSDGASLCAAFRQMRDAGLTELAFYHSHPTSEPVPSRKDLERNEWGEAVMQFIVSLQGERPVLRGWWLGKETFREAEWEVVEG
jgi:proteasome lid subunit RPN8/RPN11